MNNLEYRVPSRRLTPIAAVVFAALWAATIANASFYAGILDTGTFGASGSSPGQFDGPRDVCFAPDGTLFVTDSGNNRVQIFTKEGGFLGAFGSPGVGPGQFDHPHSIAISPDTSLLAVSDFNNLRVQIFTTAGVYLNQLAVPSPTGVKFDSSGNLYIASSSANRVFVYSAAGKVVGEIGADELNSPEGIALLESELAVADTGNHRIVYFDFSGRVTKAFGSFGSEDGKFDSPRGIAFGTGFSPYIADTNNNRALASRNYEMFVDNFSSRIDLDQPSGLIILPNGWIYVADTGNDRIVQYRDEYAQRSPYINLRERRIRSKSAKKRFVIRGQATCSIATRLHSVVYDVRAFRQRARKQTIALPPEIVANFKIVVRLRHYNPKKKRATVRMQAADLLGQSPSLREHWAASVDIIRRRK